MSLSDIFFHILIGRFYLLFWCQTLVVELDPSQICLSQKDSENFRGRKLLRFGVNKIFMEKSFADCSLVLLPKDAMPPNLAEKFSQIATNLEIRESFFPRKFPAIR